MTAALHLFPLRFVTRLEIVLSFIALDTYVCISRKLIFFSWFVFLSFLLFSFLLHIFIFLCSYFLIFLYFHILWNSLVYGYFQTCVAYVTVE